MFLRKFYRVRISSKNPKPFFKSFCLGRATEIHPPSTDEGLRDIGNNMKIVLDVRKSNFESQQWLRFHTWFIITLYYKIWQILQNAKAVSLQMLQKFLTECVRFCITKCDSFITKCDFYYKRRRYTTFSQPHNLETFLNMWDSVVTIFLKLQRNPEWIDSLRSNLFLFTNALLTNFYMQMIQYIGFTCLCGKNCRAFRSSLLEVFF